MPDRGEEPLGPETEPTHIWSEMFQWSSDAPNFVAMPHDRPAPEIEGPAIAWGFTIRPRADEDPLKEDDGEAETLLKHEWIDRVNDLVRLFFHPNIISPRPEDLSLFELTGGSEEEARQATPTARLKPQIPIDTRNFPFVWRGLLGHLSVESHTEFAKVLIAFSARPAERGADASPLAADKPVDQSTVATSPEHGRLGRALEKLGRPDRDRLTREDLTQATSYVYETLWRQFASELLDIAQDEAFEEARRIRSRLKIDGERLIPGEVVGSLRMAVAPIPEDWREWRKSDPVEYGWGPINGPAAASASDHAFPAAAVAAYHLLHERSHMISQIFPRSVDREFVANRVMSGRHLFLSPLGSTVAQEMKLAAMAREKQDDAAAKSDTSPETPPSRVLILLRSRPDPHQMGRLIERLHALQTLRLVALTDYEALRQVGSKLRFLGLRFDEKVSAEPGERRYLHASQELKKIFNDLQEVGRSVRGGLSFRVSRSILYVNTFQQRIGEMSCSEPNVGLIAGWQPYDEFIRRRLSYSFDYIRDLSERRDRLARRVGLLLQRLQWEELNGIQTDAHKTLSASQKTHAASQDNSVVALLLGFTAIGVSLGDGLASNLAPLRAAFLDLGQEPDQIAVGNAMFGAAMGLLVGVLAIFAVYAIYQLRNWREDAPALAFAGRYTAFTAAAIVLGWLWSPLIFSLASAHAPTLTQELQMRIAAVMIDDSATQMRFVSVIFVAGAVMILMLAFLLLSALAARIRPARADPTQ